MTVVAKGMGLLDGAARDGRRDDVVVSQVPINWSFCTPKIESFVHDDEQVINYVN